MHSYSKILQVSFSAEIRLKPQPDFYDCSVTIYLFRLIKQVFVFSVALKILFLDK